MDKNRICPQNHNHTTNTTYASFPSSYQDNFQSGMNHQQLQLPRYLLLLTLRINYDLLPTYMLPCFEHVRVPFQHVALHHQHVAYNHHHIHYVSTKNNYLRNTLRPFPEHLYLYLLVDHLAWMIYHHYKSLDYTDYLSSLHYLYQLHT